MARRWHTVTVRPTINGGCPRLNHEKIEIFYVKCVIFITKEELDLVPRLGLSLKFDPVSRLDVIKLNRTFLNIYYL